MNAAVRRSLWINGVWIGGLAALVLTLVCGSTLRLHSARGMVRKLSRSVAQEQDVVSRLPDVNERRALLAHTQETLAQWSDLVGSEARRIAELSGAARAAGVTLVSLESFEPPRRGDGEIVARSHTLVGLGDYRQVAHFLAGVYAARGLAGIEELKLESDPQGVPEMLRTTMTVVWRAPGEEPDPTEGVE